MKGSRKYFIGIAVGISLLLAAFLSPLASSSPDGLERVAKDNGFAAKSDAPAAAWDHAPIKNYALPGVKKSWAATGLAGAAGTLGTFFVVYGFARLLKKKESGAS